MRTSCNRYMPKAPPPPPPPPSSRSKSRPNIRAVAREAGVSVATVSRALRGLGHVDKDTNKRVRAAAQKLGYIRNPLLASAFSLMRQSDAPSYRETIGFLSVELPNPIEYYPWLFGVWQGAQKRAASLGYRVESIVLPASAKAQYSLGRQLHMRGIRSLVLSPLVRPEYHHLNLNWEKFAAVEVGHSLHTPTLPRVDRRLTDDMQLALAKLHARGYRHIGLALRDEDEARRHWDILSSCLLFARRTPQVRITCLFEDERGSDGYSPSAFLRWLRKRKPDVIIGNGPDVLNWLDAANISVPAKVGVCRIDCVAGRRESGLQINYENLGQTAIDLVTSFLERGTFSTFPERPILSLPSSWFEGDTLRPQE
ncbi:LacI family transcriptional regulator [Opitutaceae bacterium TAV3]|nr:LacI family transcriptional regulator [Opitutaceae bacterium TAV3]